MHRDLVARDGAVVVRHAAGARRRRPEPASSSPLSTEARPLPRLDSRGPPESSSPDGAGHALAVRVAGARRAVGADVALRAGAGAAAGDGERQEREGERARVAAKHEHSGGEGAGRRGSEQRECPSAERRSQDEQVNDGQRRRWPPGRPADWRGAARDGRQEEAPHLPDQDEQPQRRADARRAHALDLGGHREEKRRDAASAEGRHDEQGDGGRRGGERHRPEREPRDRAAAPRAPGAAGRCGRRATGPRSSRSPAAVSHAAMARPTRAGGIPLSTSARGRSPSIAR